MFTSRVISDEDSSNISFYANAHLDDVLARARGELDTTARAALYGDAEKIVCDDAPYAFTSAYRFYEVRQPYVRGYKPSAMWQEDGPYDWEDELRETVEHEYEHHGGHDTVGQIQQESPRSVL